MYFPSSYKCGKDLLTYKAQSETFCNIKVVN